MTLRHINPDSVEQAVARVLRRLADGAAPRDVEERLVDVKEERGRRRPGGSIGPGSQENEAAAAHLAEEMACFANTDGGGAIILGLSDSGERIGTELNTEWLRHRIYQLTERMVTPAIVEYELDGARLLVLTTAEAVEPVRYRGKIKWRVGANCVEIDSATWHTRTMNRRGFDWSAQPSGHVLSDVSEVAVEIARRYLRESTDAGKKRYDGVVDLAATTREDLFRRMRLVDAESQLTNAGSLLFVGTPAVGIDYIRRNYAGGDSIRRVESTDPLIVQVDEVIRAADGFNRVIHVRTGPSGLVHIRRQSLPRSAVRESIVNGVVHRDWHSPDPTFVDHVGDTLMVTSPGGFIGGITPENIITHPPKPRYRSLAGAMAVLGLAEREGIGIDRMVGEMLASGLPRPVISEIDGPHVRVSLFGGDPDEELMEFLAYIEPPHLAREPEMLMLLDVLCRRRWVDAITAAPELQRHPDEMPERIQRLRQARINQEPMVTGVKGVPRDDSPALRFSDSAQKLLKRRLEPLDNSEARHITALEWAKARGRASSTEIADLTGVHPSTAGRILKLLCDDGQLTTSSETRAGRGFHYIPLK